MALLEPKEVEVTTLNGQTKLYIISKFPAIAGRAIVAGYPLTAIPKVSDYGQNEEMMLRLMCYVGIPRGTIDEPLEPLMMTNRHLVDNHVPDYETLIKLEIEMMKYNTSFFGNGSASTFVGEMLKKSLLSASPMLTRLSASWSDRVKQLLKNSAKTTH